MKVLVEGTLFLGVATALHVALWQGLPAGSVEGAGEGGSASLSVAGTDPVLAAMVSEWEHPPATSQTAPPAPALPAEAAAPSLPVQPAPSQRTSSSPAPPMPLPQTDGTPTLPASPPVPPVAEVGPTAPPVVASPRPPARKLQAPARPPAAPAPARRAEGAGAGQTEGRQAQAEASGQGAAARQTALSEWGGQIRARIDRARPRAAGRGQVTLSLTVARDGRLIAAQVVGSSGQEGLDRAALRAVTTAGRFPAAPAVLTDSRYVFRLPVRFN